MIELLKELQNTNINRYLSISKRGSAKSISSFLLAIPISRIIQQESLLNLIALLRIYCNFASNIFPMDTITIKFDKKEFFSMIDQARKAPTKKMSKEERKKFLDVWHYNDK